MPMSCSVVECRIGGKCSFVATVGGGFGVQYTKARFVVRAAWSTSIPALIDIDDTNGIVLDQPNGIVNVEIGATATGAIANVSRETRMAAELKLINPADTDDVLTIPVPFALLPTVIES